MTESTIDMILSRSYSLINALIKCSKEPIELRDMAIEMRAGDNIDEGGALVNALRNISTHLSDVADELESLLPDMEKNN